MDRVGSLTSFFWNRAVSEAIENAQEVIFIEDWWLVSMKLFTFFSLLLSFSY